MKRALPMLLLIGLSHASPATACHRFKVWRYPTPQRCSVGATRVEIRPHVPTRRAGNERADIHNIQPDVAPIELGIPLPNMNDITWGGAMDSELELSLQRQKAIRQLSQGGD